MHLIWFAAQRSSETKSLLKKTVPKIKQPPAVQPPRQLDEVNVMRTSVVVMGLLHVTNL